MIAAAEAGGCVTLLGIGYTIANQLPQKAHDAALQVRRINADGNIVCQMPLAAVKEDDSLRQRANAGQLSSAPQQPWLAQLLQAADVAARGSTSAA